MDGGAWKAAVHGVAKSQTRLSTFTFTFHFHALEKEMATHSSVLAWRIPGTGEPGRLPSMGSHRVRHDWSDLAEAAAAINNTILLEIFFSSIVNLVEHEMMMAHTESFFTSFLFSRAYCHALKVKLPWEGTGLDLFPSCRRENLSNWFSHVRDRCHYNITSKSYRSHSLDIICTCSILGIGVSML